MIDLRLINNDKEMKIAWTKNWERGKKTLEGIPDALDFVLHQESNESVDRHIFLFFCNQLLRWIFTLLEQRRLMSPWGFKLPFKKLV